MSQAGDLDGGSASLPTNVLTEVVTDSGSAVPIANILEILGTGGITTSGSGNTVTIDGSGIVSGVASVSGTANRITSTGGANPVIDIAATYVGQTSITTLGTITTGTWNGTVIGATFGGTGQTTYATGDTLYASALNTLSKRTIGSAGTIYTVAGGVPTWGTPAGGGGMTLISTTTLSGASVTLSSIPQTYNSLFLVFNRLTNSTADGKFYLNPNGSGTNSRLSGVDNGTAFTNGYGGLFQTQNNWSRSNADNGMSLQIDNYTNSSNYNKPIVWSGYYFQGTANSFIVGGVLSESAAALTSIVLSNTVGNVSSCRGLFVEISIEIDSADIP